jgi:hypothetical protein
LSRAFRAWSHETEQCSLSHNIFATCSLSVERALPDEYPLKFVRLTLAFTCLTVKKCITARSSIRFMTFPHMFKTPTAVSEHTAERRRRTWSRNAPSYPCLSILTDIESKQHPSLPLRNKTILQLAIVPEFTKMLFLPGQDVPGPRHSSPGR